MKGQRAIYKYDAACLGDTLSRDLSLAWARLNYPGKEHLRPLVNIHIEEEMTPAEVIALAKDGASIGIPVDADKTGAKAGLDLIAKDAKEGRVCLPLALVGDLGQLNYPPKPATEPTEPNTPESAQNDTEPTGTKTSKPTDRDGAEELE
jgi:hypothetical protein